MFDRLVNDWLSGGTITLVFLLLLAPFFWGAVSAAVWTVYLMLPVYMVHQLEEHAGDRFRSFVNNRIGKGRQVLTPFATMVINVVGVWMLLLAVLYLAAWVDPDLGLIGSYLLIVNAITHIAVAVALRCYNPGLITAVVLFLPVGVWSLGVFTAVSNSPVTAHLTGLAAALLLHAVIVMHVRAKAAAAPR
ncbi:hypothetical protein GCM10011316_09020 [Roseibium aquae]|uniref:HXXEE domain-containing protein n=1 Tax=Roseibium aquae TaxID=1323746 RepID=A0A916TD93_9HYPH|nr:HXXEE domain-containing protein [Roseibium aquae]GGB39184.1 hypothetical protein GCM10011316_09020 [Roseibium aquae]